MKKRHLTTQSGQMTIEAILLMIIMMSVFGIVRNQFKSKDYFGQIINGPWSYIQAMVENGVWMPYASSKTKHPNSYARRASPKPT